MTWRDPRPGEAGYVASFAPSPATRVATEEEDDDEEEEDSSPWINCVNFRGEKPVHAGARLFIDRSAPAVPGSAPSVRPFSASIEQQHAGKEGRAEKGLRGWTKEHQCGGRADDEAYARYEGENGRAFLSRGERRRGRNAERESTSKLESEDTLVASRMEFLILLGT